MSQGEEPSIIDYARFYGLISDHLEPHPLQGTAARDTFHSLELDDDDGLSPPNFLAYGLPQERLTVDAGAAAVLSSIAALAEVPPARDDVIDIHRIRNLKLELPLLRSDHEVDMLNFGPQIVPDLEHEFLPLEPVSEEADEGLTWPPTCYQIPGKFANKSASEKLHLSSNVLAYLQETLNFHLDDHEGFECDLGYKKRVKVDPVSPPLLPLSPIATPYIPSSDTGHLDLLSDHTSPTGKEAYEAERKVFENDAINISREADSGSPFSDPTFLESDSLGDIYSPLKGIKDPPSSPPPLRASLQDRKVEVPLSPLHLERTPLSKKKSVSFSETLPELISELPPPIPKPENTSSSDIDAIFEEAIAPIGLKAERTIEQEQLLEEDTTLRVLVPIMDFSLPIAPWKANFQTPMFDNGGETYKEILTEMKALHFSKHIWPISGKAERELRWAPFPSALGRVESQERISDDGSASKFLAQPERVDVKTLTWKPEGLRLLDDLADPDGELQEGRFPEETNFEFLIKKRKLELDESHSISSESDESSNIPKANPSSKRHATAVFPKRNLNSTTQMDRVSKISPCKQSLIDGFSTMGALDEFLSIRKGFINKPKMLKAEHHFPTSSSIPSFDPPKRTSENEIPAPVSKSQVLPFPQIEPPTIPTPFVISATLLSIRPLFRRIEHLFPSAVFIERDFTLHLPPPQRPLSRSNSNPQPQLPSPKCTTAPPLTTSTIADEADLLLSPSTGLIYTTLQKIKQRSLPGQVSCSAIRERVLKTSRRYERLLILVSENRHDGAHQLDNGDSTALIEFTAFCSNVIESEVHVTFLASGEEELAKGIVAMMVKYAVAEHEEVKLIQDETLWEIWLRRAGMNAYAAQAVLGKLKQGESCSGAELGKGDELDGEWGLKAFVKMSARERYERFEVLLGGGSMLGRVGEVVDGRW